MKIEHGGNVDALAMQLGYNREDCIDFSANINPFGVSKALRQVIIESIDALVHYPDIHYRAAKNAIATYHQLPAETVLLSNGAVEIFYELARFFKPKQVLTLSPTFMEYEKAFSQVGAKIKLCPLDSSYQWTFDSMMPYLSMLTSGDVVLICNPNNPTGTLVTSEELKKVANYLSDKNIYLVIDEAFVDFLMDEVQYTFVPFLKEYPHVIVVKSLTKFYAIPGLRLGYALTFLTSCLTDIDNKRAPWSINTLADRAVPVILKDINYQKQTKQWLHQEKEFLYNALVSFHQLDVVKPTVNYIFFTYLGELDLRKALWEKKVFIRSCQNYHGLTTQHYRVAVRTRKENEQLIKAIQEIFDNEVIHEKC
ncbi:threonine-phosphate decarboxylase [Carnobacteriaceae bacterium zg-ZUI78]|uniref:threonine-phosphate decarboxylase CobD n=1 Tax=Granulicatella sp. zg-84 TaxID=2678503 RepID=UPI0013BEE781|nr:threonine-phosphate decarboxylase CobD [Granulicatella sp. zg-84]MBS4750707.1 threonine-phosphate decarboxylase [Carnobacteriaceae bacterium zg-ZUI78]NEW65954.1 threonine-phosphate decarboxylase [Granulicatella sp. zg-84]QMI85178.1 threonine-phosphate decarboxylase [Carnobacteriaceae bacterium zg-84]